MSKEIYEISTQCEWASTPDYIRIHNPEEMRRIACELRDELAGTRGDSIYMYLSEVNFDFLVYDGDDRALEPWIDHDNIRVGDFTMQVTSYDFTLTALFKNTNDKLKVFNLAFKDNEDSTDYVKTRLREARDLAYKQGTI